MDLNQDDLYLAERLDMLNVSLLRHKTSIRSLKKDKKRLKSLIELRKQNRELAERLAVMRAENDQIRAYLAETEDSVA